MEQEKERLRLEMIRKNITKEKMIDMCQDSIKKCENIISLGIDNQEELERLK